MLTLKLSHDKEGFPFRMSIVLATCAHALAAKGYRVSYSEDMHSLLIKESLVPIFHPCPVSPAQLSIMAKNFTKAWHDHEEEMKAQLLEDQGVKDGE